MAKTSLTTLKEENQLLKNQLIKQHEPKDVDIFLNIIIIFFYKIIF